MSIEKIFVRRNILFSCMLFCAIEANAGSANGAFLVTVAVAAAGTTVCTTSSGTTSSVQVQCTPGVYVSIAQVSSGSSLHSVSGPFIGSLLTTDNREAMPSPQSEVALFDDSATDADRGWSFHGQLYAIASDDPPFQGKSLAQLRERNREGTLTAVSVTKRDGVETVEMLVSF